MRMASRGFSETGLGRWRPRDDPAAHCVLWDVVDSLDSRLLRPGERFRDPRVEPPSCRAASANASASGGAETRGRVAAGALGRAGERETG